MIKCWKNQKSSKENRLYYINVESNISQWGMPANNISQWGMPANNMLLPAGWEMHLSKSKNVPFYSNFKKKISQWDMPSKEDGNEVPEGWKEMRSSKCKSIYYKNTKTGDVKWIIPDELRSDIPTPIVLSTKLDLKPMGVGIPMPSGFNTKLDFKTTGVKPVGVGIPINFLDITEDCSLNKIWEKDRLLGSGKSGSVYIACKARDDCEYVVKIQKQNKEYYTEIEALLSLQDTNAVPKVFAAWTCENFGYFVMEKLYTCTQHSQIFMWKAVDIKLDIIRKAGYLQVDIHRDNVMCNKQGEVVLIDFGYAVKRTKQGDKQEYPENTLSEKYGIPLTWEYLEIVQENNHNSYFNTLTTSEQKIRNTNIQKKYVDAKTKVLLNKQKQEQKKQIDSNSNSLLKKSALLLLRTHTKKASDEDAINFLLKNDLRDKKSFQMKDITFTKATQNIGKSSGLLSQITLSATKDGITVPLYNNYDGMITFY